MFFYIFPTKKGLFLPLLRKFSVCRPLEVGRRGRAGRVLSDASLARLKPFSFLNHESESDHLNPAKHKKELKNVRKKADPEVGKVLKVCVLGVPNAGKSTLINKLVGSFVCPVSSKVHTTRSNVRAFLNHEDSQIVFYDTPGLVRSESAKKFNLDDGIIRNPNLGSREADLLLVLHDLNNGKYRTSLSPEIIKILAEYTHIPSILVLNKIDVVKSQKLNQDIRKLTFNQLEGKKSSTTKFVNKDLSPEELYQKILKKSRSSEEDKKVRVRDNDGSFVIQSYEDITDVLRDEELNRREVIQDLSESLTGWPGFTNVFVISALKGRGVDGLKNFLVSAAIPQVKKIFPNHLKTDQNPRNLVLKTVKSKLLEYLKYDIPYNLEPYITDWFVESGILKIVVTIDSEKPRITKSLLKSSKMRQISKSSEEDLSNFFETDIVLNIFVNVKHSPLIKPNNDDNESKSFHTATQTTLL